MLFIFDMIYLIVKVMALVVLCAYLFVARRNDLLNEPVINTVNSFEFKHEKIVELKYQDGTSERGGW